MAEPDLIRQKLAQDPAAIVVKELDEFSHIASISVIGGDFRFVCTLSDATLALLVREGTLLPAPRITPERTYVHAQPVRLISPRVPA